MYLNDEVSYEQLALVLKEQFDAIKEKKCSEGRRVEYFNLTKEIET